MMISYGNEFIRAIYNNKSQITEFQHELGYSSVVWKACNHIAKFNRTDGCIYKGYSLDKVVDWKNEDYIWYRGLLEDLCFYSKYMPASHFTYILKLSYEASHGKSFKLEYPLMNAPDNAFEIEPYLMEFITDKCKDLKLRPTPVIDYRAKYEKLELDTQTKIDELTNQLKEKDNIILSLTTELQEHNTKINSLTKQLEEHKSAITRLENECEEYSRKLSKATDEYCTKHNLYMKETKTKVDKIVSKYKDEILDLKAKLTTFDEITAELEVTRENLKELETRQAKLDSLLTIANVGDLVMEF